MKLRYKDDWEETKARYLAWWNHDYIGRCALGVTAPKPDVPDIPAPAPPESIDEKWHDLDNISRRMEHRLAQTFFGGEALPVWTAGYSGETSLPTGCPTCVQSSPPPGRAFPNPGRAHRA